MITILLGLIGLSLVVIVHEFGHFAIARIVGVNVEAFSIGWGPAILTKRGKRTEWRLGILPIGGYCKLKGEDSFRTALDQNLAAIPAEAGSLYSAHPLKRIAIAIAGPAFNMLFAVFVFIIVAAIGTSIQTAPHRIVLSSETGALLQSDAQNPANAAGLQTGDIITAIDGQPIGDYSDLQQIIASNPNKPLHLVVVRDGSNIDITVTPRLDPNSGAGMIGVYAWIDPVIAAVKSQSPAAIAGLEPGDLITAADGKSVRNTIDLMNALSASSGKVALTVLRNNQPMTVTIVAKSLSDTGLQFKSIVKTDKATSFPDAIVRGFKETASTFTLTLKSIGLLFRGVNVFKAISGPARITYLIGSAATEQFKAEGLAGLVPVLSFLAFLSVSLAIMNLLPLPILDGGLILMFIIELLRQKSLSPKTLYRYQFVGVALVLVIFAISTLSDIFFFTGK